ncbi:hypothetical protein PIB30_053644 [Stylosanthes scabra]|uniref:Uncharacterized protein n=1 Tax=Stylosanthes scabra TaxID=79078 RepID=A0ABU6XIU2_9FABA|nr:hypothetical protein [Stylosanthes scabra]
MNISKLWGKPVMMDELTDYYLSYTCASILVDSYECEFIHEWVVLDDGERKFEVYVKEIGREMYNAQAHPGIWNEDSTCKEAESGGGGGAGGGRSEVVPESSMARDGEMGVEVETSGDRSNNYDGGNYWDPLVKDLVIKSSLEKESIRLDAAAEVERTLLGEEMFNELKSLERVRRRAKVSHNMVFEDDAILLGVGPRREEAHSAPDLLELEFGPVADIGPVPNEGESDDSGVGLIDVDDGFTDGPRMEDSPCGSNDSFPFPPGYGPCCNGHIHRDMILHSSNPNLSILHSFRLLARPLGRRLALDKGAVGRVLRYQGVSLFSHESGVLEREKVGGSGKGEMVKD